jgi:hypothetical protein
VDLFTAPGPGAQVHDYNGAIQLSGLFWVVELPDDALEVGRGGLRATLEGRDVSVVDTFQFFRPDTVPATLHFEVRWDATGPRVARGAGTTVSPTDPAAFVGRFADALSTGRFSGSQLGFSFRGSGSSANGGFAEMGEERNGRFLP